MEMDFHYSEEGRKKFYEEVERQRKEIMNLHEKGIIDSGQGSRLFKFATETEQRYEKNRIAYFNEQIALNNLNKKREKEELKKDLGDISLQMNLLRFSLECIIKEKRQKGEK
ncbi:MAG: hypothetical protein WC781_05180 [Candidatus Pacearchaeota archaeon]